MATHRIVFVFSRWFNLITKDWKRLDKRFPEKEEAEYRQSLERDFLLPGIMGAALGSVTFGFFAYEMHVALKDSLNDDLFISLMVGSRCCCAVSSAIVFVIAILKRWKLLFSSLSLEKFLIAWTSMLQINVIWFSSWHGPKLCGKDPYDVYPDWSLGGADGSVLLGISAIICVSCLATPIRSHISWLVPACGLVSYLCATGIAGSSSPAYVKSMLACLTCLMACALFGSYKNDMHRRKEWLAQGKVGMQKDLLDQQHRGVCRLMNILCDCMVRVGSDCHILEPNPRFAAILMNRDRRCMEGTCIYDYIPYAVDRERFREMVLGRQSETAGMIHVSLRDSYGKVFPIHLYHTQIIRGEESEYLIGIQENTTREPEPAPGIVHLDYSQTFCYSRDTHEAAIIGFTEQSKQQGQTPEVGDTSISSNESSVGADTVSDLGAVTVDFIVADGFPITRCTPGFLSLVGPLTEMQQLTDFIGNDKRLECSLQGLLNVFCNACRNVIFDGVKFGRPNGNLQYLVDALTFDVVDVKEKVENDDGFEVVVRAQLDGIHQRRHSKRARRSRRRHFAVL